MSRYNEDDYYYEEKQQPNNYVKEEEEEFGCSFCYDKRTKKDIELYFFDRANNMRLCSYCPYCGRKF